jgi:hypothetical protein
MKKKIISLCFSLLLLLSSQTFSQGPGEPYNPMTANGARHILRINNQYFGHKLFWKNPSGSLYNDIYFSQDSNQVITLDSTALVLSGFDSNKVYNEFTLSTIGTLENHTKYYWRIVEHNSTGSTEGQVWYFISESQGLNIWIDYFNNGLSNYIVEPPSSSWAISNSSNAGGNSPELRYDDSFYNGISYLILNDFFDLSPSLNPLSFKYSFDFWYGEYLVGFAYSLDEGNTWTPFWQQIVTQDIPPTNIFGELVPNENYVKLALFCSGSNSSGIWYVDNLILDSPLTIPTPPAQIQARADTSSLKVFLSWTPGFAVDPITGYKIQRKVGLPINSNIYQTITEVGPYVFSFEDLSVQLNTIYTYRIQTIVAGGLLVTTWSNDATAYVPNIVPVELQNFSAEVIENKVTLNWSTSTETNNQGFEILRNAENDQNSWEKIGFNPGFGTTTEVHHYSFVDESLQSGNYQYRLKQIDFDGTFEYSNIIEVTVEAPAIFSVEQNYPNPFNPTTKIKFSIPAVTHRQAQSDIQVTLTVYDVLGEEIATLVNEQKPAGTYEVEFNVAQVSRLEFSSGISAKGGYASGIYFYQLKADEFLETKKMIILK